MHRLLIVEDQPAQREIFRLVFEDDYEVRTACNGFEALGILAVGAGFGDYGLRHALDVRIGFHPEHRENRKWKIEQ